MMTLVSEQDFSRRIIIVVLKDLLGWQAANAIAHIGAYLGKNLADSFGTGEFFQTSDGIKLPRNSQYPIIIKRANSSEQLQNLFEKIRATDLLFHAFIREMIDHTDDAALQSALMRKSAPEMELLGVGVFGENEVVAGLTKKFGLWE